MTEKRWAKYLISIQHPLNLPTDFYMFCQVQAVVSFSLYSFDTVLGEPIGITSASVSCRQWNFQDVFENNGKKKQQRQENCFVC